MGENLSRCGMSDDESRETLSGVDHQIPPGGVGLGGGVRGCRNSLPPYLSVNKVMQYLKGKTGNMLMAFWHLLLQFWRDICGLQGGRCEQC
jgi:hypothetical protein